MVLGLNLVHNEGLAGFGSGLARWPAHKIKQSLSSSAEGNSLI